MFVKVVTAVVVELQSFGLTGLTMECENDCTYNVLQHSLIGLIGLSLLPVESLFVCIVRCVYTVCTGWRWRWADDVITTCSDH